MNSADCYTPLRVADLYYGDGQRSAVLRQADSGRWAMSPRYMSYAVAADHVYPSFSLAEMAALAWTRQNQAVQS